MKICLFSLCFLDGKDASSSFRLLRNIKYIKYYWSLREILGFQTIEMCDNASNIDLYNTFQLQADSWEIKLNNYRFEEHLARGNGYSYFYNWRGLHHIKFLIEKGYEKIICIDSDGF